MYVLFSLDHAYLAAWFPSIPHLVRNARIIPATCNEMNLTVGNFFPAAQLYRVVFHSQSRTVCPALIVHKLDMVICR